MPIVASFNFLCDCCGQCEAESQDVAYGFGVRAPDLPEGWANTGPKVFCKTCVDKLH